jgi:hypothetical protein
LDCRSGASKRSFCLALLGNALVAGGVKDRCIGVGRSRRLGVAILSREEIVRISLRLISVYILISMVSGIPAVARSYLILGASAEGFFVIGGFILMLIIGGVLWFFPLTFAQKILPSISYSGDVLLTQQQSDYRPIFSIGLSLIGVWFFVGGFGNFVYWSMILFASWDLFYKDDLMQSVELFSTVSALLQILLSASLILFGRSMAKVFFSKPAIEIQQ